MENFKIYCFVGAFVFIALFIIVVVIILRNRNEKLKSIASYSSQFDRLYKISFPFLAFWVTEILQDQRETMEMFLAVDFLKHLKKDTKECKSMKTKMTRYFKNYVKSGKFVYSNVVSKINSQKGINDRTVDLVYKELFQITEAHFTNFRSRFAAKLRYDFYKYYSRARPLMYLLMATKTITYVEIQELSLKPLHRVARGIWKKWAKASFLFYSFDYCDEDLEKDDCVKDDNIIKRIKIKVEDYLNGNVYFY
ncbi:hypothetical protein MHBO_000752 [Bonamia ostreae]|uniref:Uncharacterized protein n=1 Tax=Bonamia ostreae TaxID=126728 RepID=A0ABV2AGQ9_9EUKA